MLQNGKVIEYASRAMTEAEMNYAQIEKELLSIVFGFERYHTYLYARPDKVRVQTDHKPLLAITKKALGAAPKRLQRMLLRLQRYNFDLQWVPGSDLVLADTLSRAVAGDATNENTGDADETAALTSDDEQLSDLRMVASQSTINAIRAAAADDRVYQQLKQQIIVGWPDSKDNVQPELRPYFTFADELAVSGDFIFKGHRIVIPFGYRDAILERLHSTHIGINSCIRRARETCFYPGMTADIKRMISACPVCVRLQTESQKEPLLSHESPSRIWEKVGVDIFTFHGHDYLITVDYLSNYFEVDRLPSKKIPDVIYVLKQHFARYGVPSVVFSDGAFVCQEFQKFADSYEFEHHTSSPRFPSSNGKSENAVKTAKKLMTKAMESGSDPFLALLEWRNCPSEQLSQSPVQLLMGRRTRTPFPTAEGLLSTPTAQAARLALTAAKHRQAHYYNRSAKQREPLPVGQTVRVRFDNKDWRKAEVSQQLPYRSYKVKFADGTSRRRTSRHVRFSNEPPLIINDDPGGSATSTPTRAPPSGGPTSTSAGAPSCTRPPDPPDQLQQQKPNTAVAAEQYTTRSGRVVRKPARYSE